MSGGVVNMLNFIGSRIFMNHFEKAMEIIVTNKIWYLFQGVVYVYLLISFIKAFFAPPRFQGFKRGFT